MIGFDRLSALSGASFAETQQTRRARPLPEREGPALAVGRQARVSSTTTLS
jgi:hypothetical protein